MIDVRGQELRYRNSVPIDTTGDRTTEPERSNTIREVPIAVRAMKAGAIHFVEKPFSEETILNSIALAQEKVARSGRSEAARVCVALPTERERQVLKGLASGLPNKTVAYDLGISLRTVEVQRARIMEKMTARNLSHLVRLARAAGIEIAP